MASRSLGSLTIDLIARVGGFTAGLSQAEREATRRTSNIKRSLGSVRTAFAALGAGLLVREIISATIEAEKSFALLENAVQATGGAAGYTATQLAEMAGDLQKVTTYSDDAIQGAEQLLLRFRSIQGTTFDQALTSTLDLATALGKDLESAALLVGKALESPVKGMAALAKSGVVLSEEQQKLVKRLVETGQKAQAQQVILDALKGSYGGAAEAARDTLGGALEGLKNAFGDLLEGKSGVGGATDAINDLTDTLSDPDVKAGFDTLISGLFGVVSIAGKAAAGIASVARETGEFFARLVSGPDIDDQLVDLNNQIRLYQDALKTANTNLSESSPESRYAEQLRKRIAANQEALEKLIKQRDLLTFVPGKPSVGTTGAGGSGGAASTPDAGGSGGKLSDEFAKISERLNEQIALYGKTGEAAKLAYEIQSGALDELSKKEQDHLLALAEQYDAIVANGKAEEEAADIRADAMQQRIDAARQFSQSVQDDAFEDFGKRSDDAVEAAVAGIGKQIEESADIARAIWEDFAQETQNIIAGAILNGFDDGAKGLLKSFAQMIAQMAAQAAAANLTKALFGSESSGSSGFLGSLFNGLKGAFGFRAVGGPVSAGGMYRVNEMGPELLSVNGSDYLMMGKNSGKVTANNRLGGARVEMHIHGVTDADSFRKSKGQIHAQMVHALGRSSSRDA